MMKLQLIQQNMIRNKIRRKEFSFILIGRVENERKENEKKKDFSLIVWVKKIRAKKTNIILMTILPLKDESVDFRSPIA